MKRTHLAWVVALVLALAWTLREFRFSTRKQTIDPQDIRQSDPFASGKAKLVAEHDSAGIAEPVGKEDRKPAAGWHGVFLDEYSDELKNRAEQGDAAAQEALGDAYSEGSGVEK